MAKDNLLSAEEVKRVVGATSKRIKKVIWHTTDILVKYSIGLSEYIATFNSIIRDCTSENGELALPLIDFAIRVNIISHFSNVELPQDPSELFDVVYTSDLYDVVRKNANARQIDAIEKSIYKSIGWGEE